MGGILYICTGQCSVGQILLMFASIFGSILLTLCCYLGRVREESEDRKGLVGHMEAGARRPQRAPTVAPHVARSEAEQARLASLGGWVPPSRAWVEAPAAITYALPTTSGLPTTTALPTGVVPDTHSSTLPSTLPATPMDSSRRLTINFPRNQ